MDKALILMLVVVIGLIIYMFVARSVKKSAINVTVTGPVSSCHARAITEKKTGASTPIRSS